MEEQNYWFEIIKINDHLIAIREKLSEVDPRFLTEHTNLFLLIGASSALLIDTGCGLFPIKPTIDSLIGDKKLIVINTHVHWDHVGGNHEFNEVHIHEREAGLITRPLNLSFLKDSSKKIVHRYEKFSFSIPPSPVIKFIKEGDRFDLGDLKIKVLFTPGHSIGSISLFTNKGELFTGDTAHFGAYFLPRKKDFPIIVSSLLKLIKIQYNNDLNFIYPSHEQFPSDISLLTHLRDGILNIERLWKIRKKNSFLNSWVINGDKFQFIVSMV